MPKALSAKSVERFHEDGFHPAIPILTPDEVAYYRGRLERFEERYPEHVVKLKSKANLLCPWVDELARHPKVLDIFEDLLGPNLLCWTMAFRIKEADGRTFAGWHQDTVYNPVRPIIVFGALALSECGVEQGCLRAIPGSHNWGILPHEETGSSDSILVRGQYIASEFDQSNAVDLVLRPGEMALFNNQIVHGSQPNIANDRRILLLIEMMPAHAYQPKENRESAMLVRGIDPYGNFGVDPRPDDEMSPTALAGWQRAIDTRGKVLFADSRIQTYGAYTGIKVDPGNG